jgi:hypothetical protein
MYENKLLPFFNIGLCQGRHEIQGVKSYFFPQEVNPLDIDWLNQRAVFVIDKMVELAKADGANGLEVNLYVTGLTVTLVAVINACSHYPEVELTLWHYDRVSGQYYPQTVY